MKPAAFEYARPANLDDACALLASSADARPIAGGQTLVPLMAMRMARPSLLVDISRLAELAFVRREGDSIVIGAATKQCVLEHDPLIRTKVPLLAKVIPCIGHAPTRARGTVGGSLANADPAAEIALVAVTLGATLHTRDGRETVGIPAADFFLGPMMTAMPTTALLTAVRFPVWPRCGTGFHEISARRSDFAFASAAAQIVVDGDGHCRRLAIGLGAVAAVPLRLAGVETALLGTRAEPAIVREALAAALADIEPLEDLHASAAYRRRAALTLAMRAIADAYLDAVRPQGSSHAR